MSRRWLATALALAIVVVIGCAGGSPTTPAGPGSPGATATGTTALSSAVATRVATPIVVTATEPAMPPEATLSVEGGDPVRGQLGSYTWEDAGSDSPWLTGSPIPVGAGEPLTLRLDPAVAVGSWRARTVPADQTDATGARPLGGGTGEPVFAAPPAGRWTVEVQLDLPSGPGSVTWYWLLDVT